MVSRLNRKDPAEAAVFLRAVLEGALVEKCAFMFQGDMLNGGSIADLFKTPEPSARAVAQFTENQALEIGYTEGLQGGSIDNLQKQFREGSAELSAAIRGFKRGRQFMEASSPPGVVPVAPSPGRRGGRRKAAAAEPAPDQSETEERLTPEDGEGDDEHAHGTNGTMRPVTTVPSEPIDMGRIIKLSNHKMAVEWNRLTGQNIKKFENRDVAIGKFQKLVAAQENGDSSVAH
jgi:hypothetical protein